MISTESGGPAPSPGTRVGRYLVTGEIGRGAMGVVYRATDPAIGRTVALKTIRLHSGSAAERQAHLDRLRREAQSGGRLLHPNIVTVFDFVEAPDTAFVCMEFVDGPSLEALMASGQPLDPRWVLSVLEQAAAALDYAHTNGIVHRDVKPANLLLQDGTTVKVSDFGIARMLADESTMTGPLMGTPSYMSPEQAQSRAVGGRSDQFSLAVIAYELLTGAKPFEGYSLASVVYKVCNEVPAPAATLNADLPPSVDQVLAKALSKDPALRFPSVSQFVAALDESLRRTPGWKPMPRRQAGFAPTVAEIPAKPAIPAKPGVAARPIPPAGRVPPVRPQSRSLWWWTLAGFLVAGGAFWLVVNKDEPLKIASLLENSAGTEAAGKPSAAGDAPVPLASAEPASGSTEPPPEAAVPSTDGSNAAPAASDAPASLTTPETPAVPPVVPESRPAADAGTRPPVTKPPEKANVTPPAAEEPRFAPHPVEILTEPPGATVMIDDNPSFTCTTPCQLTLGTGRHVLRFSRDGHRPSFQSIDVPQSLSARVRLEPRTGTVMVKTNPPGASILIDGREWRSKTPTMVTLPAGRHKLVLRLEGLPDESSEVEIRDNAVATLEINWK